MQGYSGHTLKMVNKSGKWVYVQIHCLSQQGVAFLSQEKAGQLAGSAPDYATRDLFEAIGRGDYPEWKCYLQSRLFCHVKHTEASTLVNHLLI